VEKKGEKVDVKNEIANGRYIYTVKPSRNTSGEVWSGDDYASPAFLYHYIKYKSIQRFTESYNMMIRAYNKGILSALCDVIFDGTPPVDLNGTPPIDVNITNDTKPEKIKIASIGGGPGFELYATEKFLKQYFPKIHIQTISQDLNPLWEKHANIFQCEFIKGDFYSHQELQLIIPKCHILIFSYVVCHYMRETSLILNILQNNPHLYGIFINERVENIELYNSLESKGVRIFRLIDQTYSRDDRQVFLTLHNDIIKKIDSKSIIYQKNIKEDMNESECSIKMKTKGKRLREEEENIPKRDTPISDTKNNSRLPIVFPNVPFENIRTDNQNDIVVPNRPNKKKDNNKL